MSKSNLLNHITFKQHDINFTEKKKEKRKLSVGSCHSLAKNDMATHWKIVRISAHKEDGVCILRFIFVPSLIFCGLKDHSVFILYVYFSKRVEHSRAEHLEAEITL